MFVGRHDFDIYIFLQFFLLHLYELNQKIEILFRFSYDKTDLGKLFVTYRY